MIDISPLLHTMCVAESTWHQERSVDVAETVSAALAGRISWDNAAGEDWIQVMGKNGVIAFVGVRWPVVIMLERDVSRLRSMVPDDVAYLAVGDMDEPELIASKESLFETFGDRARSAALAPGGFSAKDLWFATV